METVQRCPDAAEGGTLPGERASWRSTAREFNHGGRGPHRRQSTPPILFDVRSGEEQRLSGERPASGLKSPELMPRRLCDRRQPHRLRAGGIAVQVVWECEQRNRECPAATAHLGCVINLQRDAKCLPAFAGEECPRGHQTAGGIPRPVPEIDDAV